MHPSAPVDGSAGDAPERAVQHGNGPAMGVTWGAVTDRGLRRPVNEDAMLADPPVFAVADGMGGHAAGDVASRLTIDRLADLVGHGQIGAGDVIDAISAANHAIVEVASQDVERTGMGTTVSGIAMVSAGGVEHWMVFNIGDSRVYRFTDGRLVQLTVDHSEVEELVAAGTLTPTEARSYHRRNVVTRSLGSEPIDMLDSWLFPAIGGERFLICSDGLTREVDDAAIGDCLAAVDDPQSAAEQLVQQALHAGAHDNVTVLVVDGDPAAGEEPGADGDTFPRKRHVP